MANRRERRAARAGKGRDRRPAGSNAALVAARRLYETGRFAEAARLCEEYLTTAPRDPLALYLLGMAAIGTGQLALAETSFAEALAQRPTEPAFHNGMALLRAAQQRFTEALANHDRALALAPDDVGALLGRAQALVELDELVEAERTLHRAGSLAPRSPEVWRNLAAVRAERGLVAEAVAAYETLITLDPGSAEAHFGLATVLAKLGRLAPAADACTRAIALDAALPGARQRLVELLCDLGRLQEALACGLDGLKGLPLSRNSCLAFVSALARSMPAAHDPEIALAIERCFEAPDIDYDDLAKPAARQIRMMHGIDGEPRHAGAEAVNRLLEQGALPPVLGEPILRLLLTKTVNRDLVLEAFLTATRSRICLAPAVPTTANPFLAALALQGFNNGYVFALSAEEERQIAALKTALEAELQVGFEPSPERETRVLCYALYAPLLTLEGASRLAEAPHRPWSDDFHAVLERTLREPLEERAISATMPSLSAIGDPTSLKVGAQYEEHPYPRWLTLPRPAPERFISALRQKYPNAMLPRYLDDKIEILIAGAGTGIQPIATALSLRNVEVLAVDLSRASLAYAKRMAAKLEVANIQFLQADLLRLGELGRQFPAIEVVGVLHHLQAPMAGWRVLTSLLRPGGLMRIGLYSALARAEIVAARERIAALGLKPVPADIRQFRERVLFGSEAAEFPRLALSKDIYDLNGCRDLLFHACEHQLTLPEIQAMLAELGLEFLGFEDLAAPVARHYRAAFPQDRAMTDLANWARFEEAHRDTFPMYVFWCAKRSAG